MSSEPQQPSAALYRTPGWDQNELRKEAISVAENVLSDPSIEEVVGRRYARSLLGRWMFFSGLMLPVVAGLDRGYSFFWLLMATLAAPMLYGLAQTRAPAARRAALRYAEEKLAQRVLDPTEKERFVTAQGIENFLSGTLAGAGRPTSWLLAGGAMVLPLWIHALVAFAFKVNTGRSFDTWVLMSALIVGHCHLVLAALGWRHGNRVEALTETEVGSAAKAGWKALGWTVLASTIPGILLMGVPVALVALTGLMVPILWKLATEQAWRERNAIRSAVAKHAEPLHLRVSVPPVAEEAKTEDLFEPPRERAKEG